MHETYEAIREMIERDMREVAACGEICPDDYPKLKAMISSFKKLKELDAMEGEKKAAEEGYWDDASRRVPRMESDIHYSTYNPNRSPKTGRYTSNASYHDQDGSMTADLNELLGRTHDDHDRMIIMRLIDKVNQH